MTRDQLIAAAEAVDATLPENHGFVLLLAPFGDDPDRSFGYISAMQTEDAVALVNEWLLKCGASAKLNFAHGTLKS